MGDDNNNEQEYVFEGGEEEDEEICKVYDKNDFFTVLVQMLLAGMALLSLWFKRMTERPRRKFLTWFLDVFKQGLGAGYAHVCNMAIAAIISNNHHGDSVLKDQCAWYGMSYLIDTTLGLFLAILLLGALAYLANEYNWKSLKHSGVYDGPDAILHWIHQVLAWLIILTLVKIIIYYFMVWCSGLLAWVGSVLFAPLQANIRFELVFVMILFPGVLNVIYFWVADGYLKAKSDQSAAFDDFGEEMDGLAPTSKATTAAMTPSKKEALLTVTEQKQAQDKVEESRQPWTNPISDSQNANVI